MSASSETLESVRAENARLRAENAQLRADVAAQPAPFWFDAVNDAIFVSTAGERQITHWNRAAEHMYGWSRDEAVGRLTREIIPAFRYLDGVTTDMVLDALATAGEWRGTLIQATRDGRELIVDGSTRPLYDDQGEIVGYIAINRDVTGHYQAEQARRAAEARYQSLFERMAQGVVYHAADGSIIDCNPAAERILGVTLDQMQGRTPLDPRWRAVHADGNDFPGELHPAMVALQRGEAVRNVVMGVYHRQTAAYRWLSVNALPEHGPGTTAPAGVFVTFDDITERLHAEQARQASEERLRAVLDNGAEGVLLVGPDRQIDYVSSAVSRILGYTADEIRAIGMQAITHPEDWPAMRERLEQLFAAPGATSQITLRARHRNGSWRWLERDAVNALDNAAIGAVIVSVRDVTEQLRAEQVLREQAQVLDQAQVLVRDATERITLWTQGAEQLYGYTRAEALGCISHELLQTVFPEPLEQLNAALLADGRWSGQLTHRTRVGQAVVVASQWLLERSADGQPFRVIEANTDITALERATARLKVLAEASRLLAIAGVDTHAVFSQIATFASDHLDASCVVNMRSNDGQSIRPSFWHDRDPAVQAMLQIALSQLRIQSDDPHPTARAIRDGRAVFLPSIDLATIAPTVPIEVKPFLTNLRPHSTIIVPLRVQGSVIGSLSFTRHAPLQPAFTEDDLRLAEDLADRAALAIANAQLFQQAQHELAERTRSEVALQVSEETLRIVTEAAGIGLALIDADERYRYANQIYKAIYGRLDEDLADRHVVEVLGERFESEIRPCFVRAFRGESVSAIIQLPSTPGPEQRSYEVRIEQSPFSTRSEIVVVLIDITDQQHAEAALRASEERYRAIIENGVEGIVLIGANHHPRYVSPTITALLGYSTATFAAMRVTGVCHPDDLPQMTTFIETLIASTGAGAQLTVRLRHQNGSWRWLEIRGINQLSNPAVRAMILSLHDVTERVRAQDALTAEHERVVQLKNEFMAMMSHELRTPLAAVLGNTQLLQEEVYGPLTERQQTAIQRIDQSGQNLLALINDILDYTRFEAGQVALTIGPTAVASLCRDSVRAIGAAALAKHIVVTLTLSESVTLIQADGRRLAQMLGNLLSNAVKFTPAGGEIGLEVQGDQATQTVTFTVWDTGIGIAAEDLPRLFQPFTQLDSRLSREYEGTGLGLALVRRLAQAHGGSVGVVSRPNEGSRFSITLPWDAPSAQADTSAPALSPPPSRAPTETAGGPTPPGLAPNSMPMTASGEPQPTLLLVEDHESNAIVLREMLEAHGYHPIVAYTGSEGLARAYDDLPALILMDIQLPGISGLEAIQRLRADPRTSHIPVIALTALVLPGDRERCIDAGANVYLAKPVNMRALLDTIDSILVRHDLEHS
jgi:PAS domain S-box-containing protein